MDIENSVHIMTGQPKTGNDIDPSEVQKKIDTANLKIDTWTVVVRPPSADGVCKAAGRNPMLELSSPPYKVGNSANDISPISAYVIDDLVALYAVTPREDLMNLVIKVPEKPDLRRNLEHSARGRYRPDLLIHAGQNIRLGQLLAISAKFTERHAYSTFSANLNIASCLISNISDLVAADRLLKPVCPADSIAPSAITALLEQSKSDEPSVRFQAFQNIEKFGPHVPSAIPALIRGQADVEAEAYLVCKGALKDYGIEALPHLTRALLLEDSKSILARGRAALVIEALGRAAASSAGPLLELLKSTTDPWLQHRIISTLASIGGDNVARTPDALDVIWGILKEVSKTSDLHRTARRCLDILSASGTEGQYFTAGLLRLLAKPVPESETREPYQWPEGSQMSMAIYRALGNIWFDTAAQSPGQVVKLSLPDDEKIDLTVVVAKVRESETPSVKMQSSHGELQMY